MDKINLKEISLTHSETRDATLSSAFEVDQVGPGKTVTLHFELSLSDGKIIDSNFSNPPVNFVVGDGKLMPGFEKAIFGMRSGEEKTRILPSEQAFGQLKEENVHTFSRYRFPADLLIENGLVINFTDQGGNEQPGVITMFNADNVEIDFNHPLAGRDIQFRVKIFSVTIDNSEIQ